MLGKGTKESIDQENEKYDENATNIA